MMSLHYQLYICVLCVINLTVSLLEVSLQVPRLLVRFQGTCSSVGTLACSHLPPDVNPVTPPPRAGRVA